MIDDDFFAALTAPLKTEPDVVLAAAPEPPPAINLEPGHYVADHNPQVSFFEPARGGNVSKEMLESILGEPYPVLPMQRYQLCIRHILTIDNIIDPPHNWRHLLDGERMLILWPDVLAADYFHFTAPNALLVQPDPYIAGIILNYYLQRHGKESVTLIE